MFERWLTWAALKLLLFYQRRVSPRVSRRIACRFHPTCSEFALQALRKYGLRGGLVKTWQRLRRCRPDNLESCIDFP